MSVPETPRVLADVADLLGSVDPAAGGALWRLAETGRQLDANVIRIPAGQGVDTHAEPDLDVLLVVVGGSGTLTTEQGPCPLGEGAVCWLPRGSSRALRAGEHGLAYLTVHRRRPGMQIGRTPP